MKKILPVIVVLIILGVGGYFYLNSRSKISTGLGNNTRGGNVFTSIRDAMSKSISLKCVYKDEKGIETTTYIKGGAVRVMMTNSQNVQDPNNILMKDKKMYMWSDVNKTGFVFTVEDPSTSPYPTFKVEKGLEPEKQPGTDQQESVLATIEKYKDACKTEVIADSMFTVPSDVQFQDMNALQEQMIKGLPQAPESGNEQEMQNYINDLMQQQGVNQ